MLYQSKADMTNYITSGTLTNYVNTTGNQIYWQAKRHFTGGINTKSQTVSGATVLGNDILGGVVKYLAVVISICLLPVDNAGGRISFYFEADCALNTPSGNFIGTIGTGGSRQDYYRCIIWKTSWNAILMEQTGLLCVVQAMFRR
jgi:hypothetical protein